MPVLSCIPASTPARQREQRQASGLHGIGSTSGNCRTTAHYSNPIKMGVPHEHGSPAWMPQPKAPAAMALGMIGRLRCAFDIAGYARREARARGSAPNWTDGHAIHCKYTIRRRTIPRSNLRDSASVSEEHMSSGDSLQERRYDASAPKHKEHGRFSASYPCFHSCCRLADAMLNFDTLCVQIRNGELPSGGHPQAWQRALLDGALDGELGRERF